MQSHKKNINRTKMVQKLLLMGTFVIGITVSSVYSMESYSQKTKNGALVPQHHLVQKNNSVNQLQNKPKREYTKGEMKQIRKSAEEGHIPSKLILLKGDIKKYSTERNQIEEQKKNIIKNLHENNTLIDVKSLMGFEKEKSALDEKIQNIIEYMHELEDIQIDNKNRGIDPDYLLSSDDSKYAFNEKEKFDDKLSNKKVPKSKANPTLDSVLNYRLKSVHSFLEWRLNANQKILDKLEALYYYDGFDSKIILDGLLEEVEREIASNKAKISKDKAYLSHKPKNNNEKQNIIQYCDKILNFYPFSRNYEYKYNIFPTIFDYIGTLAEPHSFLSAAHTAFLREALEVINAIMLIESSDAEESNNQKFAICQKFVASHDAALKRVDIPLSEKLEMAMATLHFASRQLKKIKTNSLDCEDAIYDNFFNLNNSILSVEGKYVSWYLNQTYKSYNHLLFRGACINHELLKFCNFSQQIQEMIEVQDYYGIIDDLIGSNIFQLPICQYGNNAQIIFIHKTAPYVFRLKNNGIYTIGLITLSSFNDNDWSLFYKSTDHNVGRCYYRYPKTFHYSSITDDYNELLKFTFYISCQGRVTSHGGVIPAGWSDRNQWQNRVPKVVRGNLMDAAHFYC